MRTVMKAVLGAALGALLLGGMPTTASAQQEDISQQKIPSLELNQADVREAIHALFKNVNASYSIAPEVQGYVTTHLRDVTFETALQNILRQVEATYRREAGVYEIVKKQVTENIPGKTEPTEPTEPLPTGKILRRIKLRSADPAFIAEMLGKKGGNQDYNVAPERSTIQKTQGGGGRGSGNGFGSGNSGNGFGNGFGSGNSGNGFGNGGPGSGFGNGNGSNGGNGGNGRGSFGG